MPVTINIPPYLRQYTADNATVTVKGKNVKSCLRALIEQYPQLNDLLFDVDNRIHNYISLFIGGDNVYSDTLEKPVKDGDTMHLIYIIGGG